MRISLVQSALAWEDKAANLLHLGQLISPLEGKTDLIILPEMFPTGFSMDAATIAETEEGTVLPWMQYWAKQLNAAVVGSFAAHEDGVFYNRLAWVFPSGKTAYYDKKHLFTFAKEHLAYSSGSDRLLLEWHGWKICPFICYDLRFPIWSRNNIGYDLLIYVANWPKPRIKHWDRLLAARAIENQCYLAAVNVVGKDGNGLEYVGHSQILDFGGEPLSFLVDDPAVSTVQLNKEALTTYRTRYDFLADQDNFSID